MLSFSSLVCAQVLVRIRPLVALESEGRETSAVLSVNSATRELEINGADPRHQLRCKYDYVVSGVTR